MDAERLIKRATIKAQEFLIEGQVAGALALMGQTLKCDPDNQTANELMGVSKYLISDLVGETQGAIDSFEKAAPSVVAYNGLALCYEKRNEFKKARRFFEKAIEIDTNNEVELKKNLIKCLIKMGEHSEAESVLPKENSNKILIGSVFANDDEFQSQLLDIQLKFLKATGCDFDHVVCLSESSTGSFHKKTKVVHEGWDRNISGPHHSGLNNLLNYFIKEKNNYKEFLFLDSDAFPIRKNWAQYLKERLLHQKCFDNDGRFCFSCNEFDIAAILRQENLEARLHASALFVKNEEALSNISFEYKEIGHDILNRPEMDICIPYYQWEARTKAYPLIRTNKVNIHPIISGIYGDCFYHHGAGTRKSLGFRSGDYHNYCKNEDGSFYTDQLFSDPFGLIGRLGWDINNYAREQI